MSGAETIDLRELLERYVPSAEGRLALGAALGLAADPAQDEGGAAGSDDATCFIEPALEGQTTDRVAPLAPVLGPMVDGRARYQDHGLIAQGGMGEIRQVRDRVLGRTVAMKLVASQRTLSEVGRTRFLAEAQATAQLQHPGIVPVHDLGQLPDGRPWFTMRQVHGCTLTDVIASVHAGRSQWTLHRLVEAFRRVCETVAYAHSRGVLHRDLKPDNVMIGAFGEVIVLDWGIARVNGEPGLDQDRPPVAVPGAHDTRQGAITGTPAYMAPEQAWGSAAQIDQRTDVYCLGAVLYQVLSGRAPYGTESAVKTVRAVRRGPPPPPDTAGTALAPPELVAVCQRAMARDPALRHADAQALAQDVADWLDGARRRQRALAEVARADEWVPQAQALRNQAAMLRIEATARLHGVEAWDPAERKLEAWGLEDRAELLSRQADLAEVQAEQALHGALTIDPDVPEAHIALARRHRAELAAAELVGDRAAADRAAHLLGLHARALPEAHPVRLDHLGWLRGQATLSIDSAPAGAEVQLMRLERRERRLVPVPAGAIGRTPLRRVEVPAGRYLCRLEKPGYEPVLLPLELLRGQHEDGRPPGPTAAVPVRLPRVGSLGPDDVVVPPGPVWIGGEVGARVGDPPPRRAWCHGMVVRRYPVTVGEYASFLNDLLDRGQEGLALRFAPRARPSPEDDLDAAGPPSLPRGPDGRFGPGRDPDGDLLEARMPVFNIDLASACAYGWWEAERTGLPWRLPGELEWLRAGRGADRRQFPWGDHYEATWCNGRYSRGPTPSPAPVDAYEIDQGPTGVRCLAGGVEEWTIDPYHPDGPPLREGCAMAPPLLQPGQLPRSDIEYTSVGGSWSAHWPKARLGMRGSRPARLRAAYLGFRLVRPWG